jgi:hypothetical protein
MTFHSNLLTFLILSSLTLAQNLGKENSLNIGENFRIYPSNVSQTEVFVITHPSNSDIMFVSCNTIVFNPFFVSEGIYVTSNGGLNWFDWFGSDTCKDNQLTCMAEILESQSTKTGLLTTNVDFSRFIFTLLNQFWSYLVKSKNNYQ